MDALASTEWLQAELGAPDLRVLDATYLDAGLGRDARAEYQAAHIPGAMFMSLGDLRDTSDPLPMMLPSAATFAQAMGELGIGDGTRVVLYDNSPWRTAARAWWMLRHFGAREVAILDGGWAKWLAEGRPTASGPERVRPDTFTPAPSADHRTLDQVRTTTEQLLDARSAARFAGAEADPRPGVAPGHIPGSRNLPYTQLFQPDGTWKRGDALRTAFRDAGIDLDRPVTATCGSGITAAVLLFGLHLLGRDGALYDGSWSEWGADATTPKAVGPA